jgi:hypothetical protein
MRPAIPIETSTTIIPISSREKLCLPAVGSMSLTRERSSNAAVFLRQPAATKAAPATATTPPARFVAPRRSPTMIHASTIVTMG